MTAADERGSMAAGSWTARDPAAVGGSAADAGGSGPAEPGQDPGSERPAAGGGSAEEPVTGLAPVTEGEDVPDPDQIQREIEETRAQLAETIDAIAERVSPRRAAARGALKVRTTVQSVLTREESADGQPAALLDAPATAGETGNAAEVRGIAEHAEGSAYTGSQTFVSERVLRKDRVIVAAAAVAAVTGVVVYLRHRD